MDWYGQRLRQSACDPQWVAESLVINAQREADGASAIWELAGGVANEADGCQIRQHAIDESRHAKLYIAMLETVFPTALPKDATLTLKRQFPTFSLSDRPPATTALSEREVTDAMIQMNIGEIRTRINQLLFMPVLSAYCHADRRKQLSRMLETILADETRHVQYTARLIEQACMRGLHDFVSARMTERMDDIGRLTLSEVNGSAFASS